MKSSDKEPRTWAPKDRSIPTPRHKILARGMRGAPTETERKLWWHLRRRFEAPNTHFRRQVHIGRYIADFANHRARLIVEVDGGQHGLNVVSDRERTTSLESHGYRVLRFWNNDVMTNIDGVLAEIHRAIATIPTPNPSPQGGGEKRRADPPPPGGVKANDA